VAATVRGWGASDVATVTSSQALVAGRWYHLVASEDASTIKLYVNGQLDGSGPETFSVYRSPNPLAIGGASGPSPGIGGSAFSGRIDEVALYDKPLTPAQVTDHFQRAIPVPENVSAPTVTGTAAEDATLTAAPGSWSTPVAPSYGYQWLRCPDATGTGCAAISGATSATYVPQRADVGKRILARVTASNSSGNAPSDSVTTAVVQSFDNADPELVLSGELQGTAPIWLGPGSHPLHVEATDGTSQAPGSGITSVEVKVDGSREAYWSQPCDTRNCSMSQDFSFDAGSHSNGSHTVSASATDDSGRSRTVSWTVKVDKAEPDVLLDGTLRSDMTEEHTAESYTLDVISDDDGGGAHEYLSGVRSIEVLVDGERADYESQPCSAGGCTLIHEFVYEPASYGEGDHGVRVVVSDGAGNQAVTEWTVKGHLTTACQPSSAPSTAPVGDVAPGHAPVTATTATDAVASVQPELVDDDSQDPLPPGTPEQPGLTTQPNVLATTGTAATTAIDRNPRNGFTTSLNGTTICARPTAVDPAAKDASVVSPNAAVSANTGDAADTVVKPTPSGVETFTSIRDESAPENYAWKVATPGAELQASSSGQIDIVDPNATRAASDAGPKPPAEPVLASDIPELVGDGVVDEDTAPPDPTAAQNADDAIAAVTPVTSGDLPADATEAVMSEPPIQPPEDAAVTDDQAAIDQKAHDVQQDARQDASGELADSRAAAVEATSSDTAARAEDDQAVLAEPVVVGSITAPAAVDANGGLVPTTLSTDGDTVTLNVDHKAEGVTYPVVADPWITVHHTRLVWRCCHAVYRYETRLVGYENRLVFVRWAPRSAIFSHPHTYLGSGFYQVEWGGFISRTLMVDQPISPVYIALPFPVYKSVPVLDHSEYYLETEAYDTQEWRDDPQPDNLYTGHDETVVLPGPDDGFEAAEAAPYCYPEPGSANADYCGQDAGSNANLQAAIDEPPAANELGPPPDGLAKAMKAKSQWGMAEQHTGMFGDTDFTALGIRRIRINVPWNIMDYPSTDDTAKTTMLWLWFANNLHMKPLISFGLDYVGSPTPSLDDYRKATDKFLKTFPWVTEYTAWNEPNLTLQYIDKPKQAGALWLDLYRRCNKAPQRCVVAAGDFSDRGLFVRGAPAQDPTRSTYLKRYKLGARINPPVWAFHTYDSGRLHDCDITATGPAKRDWTKCPISKFILSTMPSSAIWLTEQGGVRRRGHKGNVTRTPAETAHDVKQLVALPRMNSRIKRFYYYSWKGQKVWDSGLIDYTTGKKRPRMYNTYRDALPHWP
jgi:hypothetical protein